VIDALAEKVASGRPVGIFGTSMGSYWASRATAHDPRIKACAVAMGCYGPMRHMFTAARPAFRANYKFMTGIEDDVEFDAFLAHMEIDGMAPAITVPYLMVHGEYDELNALGDALAWFDKVAEPKQAWIYEDEIHPMGRRAGDFLPAALDWICGQLISSVAPPSDERFYIRSRNAAAGVLRSTRSQTSSGSCRMRPSPEHDRTSHPLRSIRTQQRSSRWRGSDPTPDDRGRGTRGRQSCSASWRQCR